MSKGITFELSAEDLKKYKTFEIVVMSEPEFNIILSGESGYTSAVDYKYEADDV